MHLLSTQTTSGLPPTGVVLGKLLARTLAARVGRRVVVAPVSGGRAIEMPVSAIADDPLGTFAYASLPAAAPLLAQNRGVVNEVLVQYQSGADRAALSRRLGELPGVLAVQDSAALERAVRGFLRLFDVLVGAMLAAGALLAIGLIYTGMAVTVAQRTFELAVYDAFGVRYRTVVGLVWGENLLVAFTSVLPGIAIGWLAAREFMASFQSDQFAFPLTLRPTTPWLAALLVIVVVAFAHGPALRQLRRVDTAGVLRQRMP
jgi:ABC-type lipoprotein release transport system permease subunit